MQILDIENAREHERCNEYSDSTSSIADDDEDLMAKMSQKKADDTHFNSSSNELTHSSKFQLYVYSELSTLQMLNLIKQYSTYCLFLQFQP